MRKFQKLHLPRLVGILYIISVFGLFLTLVLFIRRRGRDFFTHVVLVLRDSHLMLEVYLAALLDLALAHSSNMRIQVLPLSEMLPAMATGVALTMHLRHVLS
jgi:hypothetical protein